MEGLIFLGNIKSKLIDWKNRLKDRHMLSIIVVLVALLVILGIYILEELLKIHIIWHFLKL